MNVMGIVGIRFAEMSQLLMPCGERRNVAAVVRRTVKYDVRLNK